MNDSELKKQFDALNQSPIDPDAKQRAIASAMREFNTVHNEQAVSEKKSQGFFARLRPTSSSNTSNRRENMTSVANLSQLFQQRWFLGGLATTFVLVIGIMVAFDAHQLKAPLKNNAPMMPEPAQETESLTVSNTERQEDQAIEEKIRSTLRDKLADAASQERESPAAKNIAPISKRTLNRSILPQTLSAPKPAGGYAPQTDELSPPAFQEQGRDKFESFETNPLKVTKEEPVSTFSVDVDTASYSFVRRQLNSGVLPQKNAVRLEEMVNYFDYAYPVPSTEKQPFSRSVTVMDSPWHPQRKLMHIGIKGYELIEQPASNLVFLLDVSGSMNSPDKLPLVKQSMHLLLSQLRADDTVAITVYAGATGTVLEPTPVREKQKILNAINNLNAGGGTAGAAGIKLAYQLAESRYRKDAVNRIILATDGDFNVGITDTEELKGFVERKREKGIYLSVLGFGAGNYHDQLVQALAQNGNGTAAYIDTLSEAQKVLVNEATSSLFPIANDVKIQVEFNPATVAEYRLLGYETRQLKREDFNNDKVDAGEIGSGHTVTAIYEITPSTSNATAIDRSRYSADMPANGTKDEYAFVKIRYKLPGETRSQLLETAVPAHNTEATHKNTLQLREARFASAVAGFAQLLKDAKYTGEWRFEDALALAQANKGDDLFGYRTEFIQLIRKAQMASAL